MTATVTAQAVDNRTFWINEEQKLDQQVQAALFPGGQTAIDRLAKQGKRPVRDLINELIDPGTEFYELSRIAGFGMGYPGVEDVPCGGVVTGIGKIYNNWTMIFANDSRVKAGTYFPITLKKHMRAQAIAERCGLNCVYIADSGGAFLPMQADVFPDDQHFGSMFFNMARMSAKGLKQITLSTGGNTAGGAYIVFMACQSVMIDQKAYSFLGGPPLVKMATGEVISAEDLGGARVHTQISGGADHFCTSQEEAIARVREILCLEKPQQVRIQRFEERPPTVPSDHIYDLLPAAIHQGIDVRAVLKCIADDSMFSEYKRDYAPGRGDNIVAGKIRIKGLPMGVIASNGVGIIFVEAARKATEWIVRCSQEKFPLLFIQNAPGYMVGSESEHMGMGKYGADMVRAVSCAQVPKFTLLVGGSYGAGNYGMCGRAYQPRQLWMWPNARISVMGGEQASMVLSTVRREGLEARGDEWPADEQARFEAGIREQYETQGHPYYASARLWDDGVIDPVDTRKVLSLGLSAAMNRPRDDETPYGIFRM